MYIYCLVVRKIQSGARENIENRKPGRRGRTSYLYNTSMHANLEKETTQPKNPAQKSKSSNRVATSKPSDIREMRGKESEGKMQNVRFSN